jgi:hypothetical protein
LATFVHSALSWLNCWALTGSGTCRHVGMAGAAETFGAGRGSGTEPDGRGALSSNGAPPEPHAASTKPPITIATNPRVRPDMFPHLPVGPEWNLPGKWTPGCCLEATQRRNFCSCANLVRSATAASLSLSAEQSDRPGGLLWPALSPYGAAGALTCARGHLCLPLSHSGQAQALCEGQPGHRFKAATPIWVSLECGLPRVKEEFRMLISVTRKELVALFAQQNHII